MKNVFLFELKLRLRNPGDIIALLLFFVLCFSLFPFALGPDPDLLRSVAPGIIWVSLLFSVQLGLPRLFAEDLEDGTLEINVLQSSLFEASVASKLLVFWLVAGLPPVLASPFAGLAAGLGTGMILVLFTSLLLGSIALCLVGALGAALSLGARQVSLVVPLLTLPLLVPVLIFGVSAVDAALNGFDTGRILLVLLGLVLLYLPCSIFACSRILIQVLR